MPDAPIATDAPFTDLPARSTPFVTSHNPALREMTDHVLLYEGAMVLRDTIGIQIKGEGTLTMKFSPKIRTVFRLNSGNLIMMQRLNVGYNIDNPLKLELTGMGRELNVMASGNRESTNKGESWVQGRTVGRNAFSTKQPDGSAEAVEHIKFHLVNFRRYIGERLWIGTPSRYGWGGRCRAEFGPWVLTLDSLPDIEKRLEQIDETGGSLITHLGDLRRGDQSPFNPKDAAEALEFSYWLLTFANGARCGSVCLSGFKATDQIWEDWTPPMTDSGKPPANWFPEHHPNLALSIAGKAWTYWEDTANREWFTRVIAMYTDCCTNTSGTEVELAKAHVALEVLAWVLREENQLVTVAQLERLNAAERLRLLLTWCDIPAVMPDTLQWLKAAFVGVSDADGPLAVTRIRNNTMHPTKKNLDQLNAYDLKARFEAWWLSLWYIEMVMLRLLGYDGLYDNRLDLGGTAGKFEKVPWAQ